LLLRDISILGLPFKPAPPQDETGLEVASARR
jgi:hypothetical protein